MGRSFPGDEIAEGRQHCVAFAVNGALVGFEFGDVFLSGHQRQEIVSSLIKCASGFDPQGVVVGVDRFALLKRAIDVVLVADGPDAANLVALGELLKGEHDQGFWAHAVHATGEFDDAIFFVFESMALKAADKEFAALWGPVRDAKGDGVNGFASGRIDEAEV